MIELQWVRLNPCDDLTLEYRFMASEGEWSEWKRVPFRIGVTAASRQLETRKGV